jgi:hypothetical protein
MKFYALCVADFDASSESELTIRRGDGLWILRQGDTGWCCAESHSGRGWVPSGHVEKIPDDSSFLKLLDENFRLLVITPNEPKKHKHKRSISPPIKLERYPSQSNKSLDSELSVKSPNRPPLSRQSSQVSGQSEDKSLPRLITIIEFIKYIADLPISKFTWSRFSIEYVVITSCSVRRSEATAAHPFEYLSPLHQRSSFTGSIDYGV